MKSKEMRQTRKVKNYPCSVDGSFVSLDHGSGARELNKLETVEP